MRPLGQVGIYTILLYYLYRGAQVTNIPYKIVMHTFNLSMSGLLIGMPQLYRQNCVMSLEKIVATDKSSISQQMCHLRQ